MTLNVSFQANVGETFCANFLQCFVQGFFFRIAHPIRQCLKTQVMAYDIQKRDAIDGMKTSGSAGCVFLTHIIWDIPASELHRVNWKDVPLPALYRETDAERRKRLADKPRHWLAYYEGSLRTNLESPRDFVPAQPTPDQVREINAMVHIENELIDEACGHVLD